MVSESKIHLFFISTLLFLLQIRLSAGQNVVKAAYWSANSEFPVSSIDSTLFTHLFCAFADLDPQTNRVVVSSANQASFSTFTQTVQQKNPSVKTLLSIGGGSSNPNDFASMVSQSSSRKSFIDSSISLARSYGFHGLDLDWEYPDTTAKMSNLGLFLNEWRAAVASESTASGKPRLFLSAAVFRNKDYYTINYPIQAISNSLDWINVMAYDFYGPGWSPTSTGPPAALYNPGTQVSGDYGITSWIQAGVPSTKIVLGFPFYGWAWRLLNANNHGLFAPANGSALPGDGSIGYGQIKTFISQNRATTVYNATVVSNYCYSGTTWIGYDDTQSISAKVSYAKGKSLLGYFAWHVGADDNWTLSKQASSTWGA
ncbi:class V chitinase-like [Tripterygium wilfordii]|uniref:class V chitinase-like n=1 Tax=Tripterygium wilfordii TaxID=458696 RepID=UPI0018F8647B|nr:class V chitinase-like [Tripterygium wilfordii]